MCYGVACGSHCVVWQVVASCGVEEGGRSKGSNQGGCQRSCWGRRYSICKPDDGSHEPKHVASCSPLFFNK